MRISSEKGALRAILGGHLEEQPDAVLEAIAASRAQPKRSACRRSWFGSFKHPAKQKTI